MKKIGFMLCLTISSCGAKPPEKKPLQDAAGDDATATDVDATSPFALACNKRVRELVYQESMEEAFSVFCADDMKPTGTFVKTLAGLPWDGENEMKVYRIGPPVHENSSRTTKLTGGGSVEIPITPEEYAVHSLNYAMDPSLAEAHGIRLVDGLKSDRRISHEQENSEAGLLGKVTSRLLIEKYINYQNIVIEYEAVRTAMKVAPDVYFISTQMTKSIQGVKDLYSIGIAYPINGKNIVTSLIMTKTDNKNQPGVAAEVIFKTFREGIQNVRANAVVMSLHKDFELDHRGHYKLPSSRNMEGSLP